MFCSWVEHDMTRDYRNFILMIISKPFYQQNLAIRQAQVRRTSQTCRNCQNCGVLRKLQGTYVHIWTYILTEIFGLVYYLLVLAVGTL